MTMPEVADLITGYAKEIAAPVEAGAAVTSVVLSDGCYTVTTDQEEWQSDTVVVATGAFNVPKLPPYAEAVPQSVTQLTPMSYRAADQLGAAPSRQKWGKRCRANVGSLARCWQSCPLLEAHR